MTLHYLFLSTGKLILPWNKWLFFVYKILYKFLSQNEILAPVSQITRMNSRKYNPLNYDIFPTPKQMQRALKPARWTHACTKGALIYHKNIVKNIFCGSELQPKEALFHLPDLPKYHLCLIPLDLIVSSFHWQMWCYLCHRSDCKRLKEKTKRDLRKVSMLKNVVISVWTHNKRFSKVGNMTCTKNCLKKISSDRTVYGVVQELQFKNHL